MKTTGKRATGLHEGINPQRSSSGTFHCMGNIVVIGTPCAASYKAIIKIKYTLFQIFISLKDSSDSFFD